MTTTRSITVTLQPGADRAAGIAAALTAQIDAIEAQFGAGVDRITRAEVTAVHRLTAQLAGTPATTPAGVAAKAAALLRSLDVDETAAPQSEPDHALLVSTLMDVIRTHADAA